MKVFKASIVLALIVVISKICGFARELVFGYFYGASAITDAFYISTLIPNFFYLVVVQAVSVAFIPVIMSVEKEKGKTVANSFATKLILYISIFCIFLSIAIFIGAKPLASFFAPGFDSGQIELTAQLLRIGCWFLLLQAPVSVLAAFSQAKKRFIIPSLFGLITDFCYIIFIVFSFKTNKLSLLGFIPVATIIIELVLVVPVACKSGFRFKLRGKVNKYIKLFCIIAIPSILSVGLNQLNTYVGKTIASNITDGAISSYNYAWNICNLYESLFISSICVVLFSELADVLSENNVDTAKVNKLMNTGVLFIGLLVLPLSIFTSFFSEEIVRIIYGRGAFDEKAISLTSQCLSILSLASFFYVLSNFGLRYLYAKKYTKYATFSACFSFGSGIIANFMFFFLTDLGIKGIALSTTIASIVNFLFIFLFVVYREKVLIKQSYKKLVIWSFIILFITIIYRIIFELINKYIPSMPLTIVVGILFVATILIILYIWNKKELIIDVKKILHRRKQKND